MPNKKILIADYDKSSLEALRVLFEAQGLDVITAPDGEKAYDLFRSEEPDLLLIEAMLPKIHGFNLTQTVSRESQGSVPIVIVTGLYKGPQYKNEALHTFGAAAYFEKPYDKEKLVESVTKLLRDELELGETLPTPDEVTDMLKAHLKKSHS
ncbi:MAG: response regulator [Acidobacteria bacterium]|nr:response regulator [Acidobacteriota bacterium]